MNVWCKCAKLIPSTEVITTYCQNVLTVLGYSGVKRLLYTPCDKVYQPSKTFIDSFDAFSTDVRATSTRWTVRRDSALFFFFSRFVETYPPFFFARLVHAQLTTDTNINISRNRFEISWENISHKAVLRSSGWGLMHTDSLPWVFDRSWT